MFISEVVATDPRNPIIGYLKGTAKGCARSLIDQLIPKSGQVGRCICMITSQAPMIRRRPVWLEAAQQSRAVDVRYRQKDVHLAGVPT
jgi:hypothetical protein